MKCDIRKFFASVDHFVLAQLLEERLEDRRFVRLLIEIIGSFSTRPGKGIPLGNLTLQLFANIYMHPFDQFVKHELCIRNYVRYADDFLLLSTDRCELELILDTVKVFLSSQLALEIHPDKVFLKTIASGMDFLGWVHFPHHRVLRTKTKKRMMRRVRVHPKEPTLQSYLGMLRHGNTHILSKNIRNLQYLFSID